MYYVYVLISDDEDNYVGYTHDLRKRVEQHNSGEGAKYTKNKHWNLVYYESYLSRRDAMIRERKLKQCGNAKRGLFKRIEHSLHELK